MRRLAVCLMVLAIAFLAAGCRGAEPSKQPPYTFTINGLPFTPRVFSLHGDPDHPAPGDLIALGTLLLTLGPKRDCHFIIKPENKYREEGFEKVLLRLADGRQRVVGVSRLCQFWNRKGNIVNPLPNLPADTIRGLWGVYIGAWSDDIAEKLRQIDPRAHVHHRRRQCPDPARRPERPPAVAQRYSISQYGGIGWTR